MVQTDYPIISFDIYHDQIRINYSSWHDFSITKAIKELNNTAGV